MQGRHPNRSRHAREPANWQERNERAYWGSDERDLPHYDDLLLPDDERDIDFHDARDHLPGDRFDERRWRAGPREAAGRDRDIPRPRERDGSDEAYREAYRAAYRQPVRPAPRARAGDEPGAAASPRGYTANRGARAPMLAGRATRAEATTTATGPAATGSTNRAAATAHRPMRATTRASRHPRAAASAPRRAFGGRRAIRAPTSGFARMSASGWPMPSTSTSARSAWRCGRLACGSRAACPSAG